MKAPIEIEGMKYITELELSGYKSIQGVKCSLDAGINIFIGANGSGKTNLLTFISKLKDEVLDLDTHYEYKIAWKNDTNYFSREVIQSYYIKEHNEKTIIFKIADLLVEEYIIKITKDSKDVFKLTADDPFLYDVRGAIEKIEPEYSIYNIENIDLLPFKPIENAVFLDYPQSVKLEISDFQENLKINIPFNLQIINSVFFFLSPLFEKKEDNSIKKKFISQLRKNTSKLLHYLNNFSPIQDVKISDSFKIRKKGEVYSFDNIQLQFKMNNEWYFWNDLSDGTRRIIQIISTVLNAEDIVLIEEPELGIHPHQLNKLLAFLKEQAKEKQIIISTHSPDVLDVLSIEELDKINVVSMKSGKTQVRKLTNAQKSKAINYYEETGTIGDYWKHSDLEV